MSNLPMPVAPPLTAAEEAAINAACTNVYVANLPPSADATLIRELFQPIGNVLHVKVLLDIATGVSRGIAFVMFDDMTTAKRACALRNKHVLDGSVLQVRLAERSAQHTSPGVHTRSRIVYIRNVPGGTHKETVRAFCEQNFGKVVEVQPHPQSCELGGPSPFNMVFVTFEQIDHACRCVEGVDGKAPFPLPYAGHPYTMAKMITEMSGEMRKSILLRRRGGSETGGVAPGSATSTPQGIPLAPYGTHHPHPQAGGSIAVVASTAGSASPQYVHISPQLFSLLPQGSGTPPASPPNAQLRLAGPGATPPQFVFAGAPPSAAPANTAAPVYYFSLDSSGTQLMQPQQPPPPPPPPQQPSTQGGSGGVYYLQHQLSPVQQDLQSFHIVQQQQGPQYHAAGVPHHFSLEEQQSPQQHHHHLHHSQTQQQQQQMVAAPAGATFLPGTHMPPPPPPHQQQHYYAPAPQQQQVQQQQQQGARTSPAQVFLVPVNHNRPGVAPAYYTAAPLN